MTTLGFAAEAAGTQVAAQRQRPSQNGRFEVLLMTSPMEWSYGLAARVKPRSGVNPNILTVCFRSVGSTVREPPALLASSWLVVLPWSTALRGPLLRESRVVPEPK